MLFFLGRLVEGWHKREKIGRKESPPPALQEEWEARLKEQEIMNQKLRAAFKLFRAKEMECLHRLYGRLVRLEEEDRAREAAIAQRLTRLHAMLARLSREMADRKESRKPLPSPSGAFPGFLKKASSHPGLQQEALATIFKMNLELQRNPFHKPFSSRE